MMSCPQLAESERRPSSAAAPTGPKPYNIFEDLEVFAHFEHYRSESYAQAIHLMSSQTSLLSDSRQSYASCATTLKELSLSAPSSPKGVHSVEKSSTLPSTSSNVASFASPKKSSSLSLSSFFRKISPRFHKNRKSKSKPWIVVEFSQKDIEGQGLDHESMADSDQSLELALQGKERYMASRTGSTTGRLSFSGSGSQSSLNAWVRAGGRSPRSPCTFQGQRGDLQAPPMERLSVRVPSAESIGACSLDVDASESSARPMMTKEASEVTLRSMVMSTRESSSVAARGALDSNVSQLSNGCWNIGGSTVESLTTKVPEHRPSYLGISCAINGYTNYSQFCRSRDSSPARLSPRTTAPHSTSPGNHLKVEPILEIKASNGRGELTNGRRHHGPQEFSAAPEPCTSLVQQRIAALYGSEAAERVARTRTRTAKSPLKLEKAISKRSPSCPAQVVRGRSKSPPVFRHLTRDFKEHLRFSEVSASPAENLPGFISAASRLPHLGSPVKRAPFLATSLRICDVDRGDSSALKVDVLEESRNCQVVNGGGAQKLNGNHAAAVDEGEAFNHHHHDEWNPVLFYVRMAATPRRPLRQPIAVASTSAASTDDFFDPSSANDSSDDFQVSEQSSDDDTSDQTPQTSTSTTKVSTTYGKDVLPNPARRMKFSPDQNVDDPFPTTGSDLAGFWDMVMLQVDNVQALFEELNVLKANNWVEPAKTESKSTALPRPVKKVASRSTPASPRRSEKAEEAAKSRLEARKRLMEAKRQARQQQQSQPAAAPNEDIAIFVPQEKTN
ncbi:hypothetical protein HPB51_022845 [Rhipicephalus microplus]|uniref:Uncharacterized protein n=1 Tax=Rhipicephalus microplus TaxID=6941 RepID=A0A9J6DQY1_RHIMP|nr:hypothetical protein HPB51_022845 [Rhipicephalus microplus]